MNWPKRDVVAVTLGAVVAVLLATDLWPGVRGPENWRWARRPLESGWPLLGVAAVFGLQLFVATRIRRVWAAGTHRVRAPWLTAAVALTFAQMVLLTAVEPGGLSNVPRRVLDPSFTSYHTIARNVEDPRRFLSRYPRIQHTFPVHGPSQPPGRVLFFRQVNEWASATADRTERWLAIGERLGGVPKGPLGTTDGQRAGAVAAGFLLMAIGSLALVPMVILVGGRCDAGAVGNAVLLMGVLPSYLLFTPQTDHVLLLLTLSAAALLLESIRYAGRAWAPALAFGAGICAGVSVFFSFTTLAAIGAWGLALGGFVVFAVRRSDPVPAARPAVRLTVGAVAGFALPVGILAAQGLDWLAVFRECVTAAHRVQVLVHGRVYSTWVTWNLWDFALFLGAPLAVHWIARIGDEVGEWRGRRAAVPFALALAVTLLVLDVSGRILGETGRIWMFLMPLAVGAVSIGLGGRPIRAVLPLALGQLGILIVLRGFLNVPG